MSQKAFTVLFISNGKGCRVQLFVKKKKKYDEFDKIKESYGMTFSAYTSFPDTGYACEIS